MSDPIIQEISPGIAQANAEGGMLAYQNTEVWNSNNLGGIVNVAHDVDQKYPLVPSLRLMIHDDLFIPAEWFDTAINFQKDLSGINKKTLVHCRMAVNRSSAVICAMMMAWGASFDEAWAKLPRKPYSAITIESLRAWAQSRGR